MERKTKALLAGLLLLLCTGCGETKPKEELPSAAETQAAATAEPDTTVPVTEPETAAPTEPILMTGTNPLTGESGYPEAAEGKRPVAVMVSNVEVAYPQYGLSEADLVFEMPVEGGVTRMMAVYADFSNVPDVCSVRSCRYYYPKVAMGLDAVYCHWGSEQTFAPETIRELGIDCLDGGQLMNSILYYRDPDRVGVYASEHTGYLKGSELPAAMERYGIREECTRTGPLMNFSDEMVLPTEACRGADIYYSNTSITGFRYSAKAEVYRMSHNGEHQMDGRTGERISFKNVFILQTTVSDLQEDGYLKRVELSGGSGYYLTMGAYQSIRWEKTSDTEPIRFYDMSGEELTVNAGNSYIGIVGSGRPLEFSAE